MPYEFFVMKRHFKKASFFQTLTEASDIMPQCMLSFQKFNDLLPSPGNYLVTHKLPFDQLYLYSASDSFLAPKLMEEVHRVQFQPQKNIPPVSVKFVEFDGVDHVRLHQDSFPAYAEHVSIFCQNLKWTTDQGEVQHLFDDNQHLGSTTCSLSLLASTPLNLHIFDWNVQTRAGSCGIWKHANGSPTAFGNFNPPDYGVSSDLMPQWITADSQNQWKKGLSIFIPSLLTTTYVPPLPPKTSLSPALFRRPHWMSTD